MDDEDRDGDGVADIVDNCQSTPSGVKVKTIRKNDTSGGMVHWDLLNEEGLEIAAGMYLYHVQPSFSDKSLNQYEHVGKFAVIK